MEKWGEDEGGGGGINTRENKTGNDDENGSSV